MSTASEWRYGAEIWIVPSGACSECLRRWRQHAARSKDEPERRTAAVEALAAAHAAVKDGSILGVRMLDTLTGEAGDHRLDTHPECPVHGEPGPTKTRAEAECLLGPVGEETGPLRSRRLDELGADLMSLVDSHLGQVRQITDHRNDEPMSGAAARLRQVGITARPEYGYGRSSQPNKDRAVALAEALERRAGMRPAAGTEVVRASKEQLGSDAVDPEDFILNDQDPGIAGYARYDPATEYDWVWGWSARRQAPILVPLQLAYFHPVRLAGGSFVYEISNGCAGGASIGEAALFGLLEVIERDAFLTSWHSGRPVRPMDTAFLDDWSRGLISRLAAEQITIEILDIGCELPGSTFMVEMTSRGERYLPYLSCAAASHPDPVMAARNALQEAGALLVRHDPGARAEKEGLAGKLLDDPERVETMDDHRAQGEAPQALDQKKFRKSADKAIPPPAFHPGKRAPWLFRDYADRVLDHAHDVIVIDQTYEPARGRGMFFVKVLAPGLHSMTFGHRRRRLSNERLARFAPAKSWRLDPHLFP